jgi:hypothetical protein
MNLAKPTTVNGRKSFCLLRGTFSQRGQFAKNWTIEYRGVRSDANYQNYSELGCHIAGLLHWWNYRLNARRHCRGWRRQFVRRE